MTAQPYTVGVDGDLIVIDIFTKQSAANVQAVRRRVEELLTQKHGPKDILVRHQGAPNLPDKQAIEATMQSLREVPFRRLAVVTTTPKRMEVTHGLFQALDASDRLKLFRDEGLAREWLKEAGHPIRTKLKKHTPHPKKDS